MRWNACAVVHLESRRRRCRCRCRRRIVRSLIKKLRRQLQGKRHNKIKLSLLRLFHVDHVVQNRRSVLSLAWREWFSCKGKEWKIYCCEFALSSEPQIRISRRRLADYVKTLHQKACFTCSTIIFLHSTNQIIYLWRCRWRCQILNSSLLQGRFIEQLCVRAKRIFLVFIRQYVFGRQLIRG